MMLVRTPQHKPSESLLGYVLRISEANGYDTPWHVLTHAGLSQGEMRTAGFNVGKLAAVLGRLPDELHDIAYSGNDKNDQREFRLLGHSLGKGLKSDPLRLKTPAICPHCVAEHGYIDAFFDLNVAVVCPFHRCKLTDHCPCCGLPLTWFRPGMLTCKCGASLAEAPAESVSPELVSLMEVIWAVLHRTPPDQFVADMCLPVKELLGTPLRALILKLPDLGGFQIRSNGVESDDVATIELLDSAALTLANWPYGFHEFLGRLAHTNTNPGMNTFGKRYEHFSKRFFSTRLYGKDFVWLRDEFVRYGVEAWDESVIDKKMLRGEKTQARFISKLELARRLNVTHSTLHAWSNQGRITLKKAQTGSQPRYLVDTLDADLQVPLAAEGSIFRIRAAAAYLGLPVSVLGRLKSTGHFPVRYRAKQKQGFHQADLDGFRELLIGRSPLIDAVAVAIPSTSLVSLTRTLREYRFHDHHRKADFVVAYLSDDITSSYRTGDSLDDIFFVKSDVEAFVSNCRGNAAGDSLSLKEAAKLIGCDPVALPTLQKDGYIVAEDGREGLRITCASISKFCAQYLPIGSLAGELETSSNRLLRLCETGAIPVMQVSKSSGGSVSFIKRGNVEALQRLSQEFPARKPKSEGENRTLAAVKLYLAELQILGGPLPRRGNRPNRCDIAIACGIDRSVFYKNEAVSQLVENYAAAEFVTILIRPSGALAQTRADTCCRRDRPNPHPKSVVPPPSISRIA